MREPDVTGVNATRAWRIVPPDPPTEKAHEASCRAWIINSPAFHLAWSWWSIHVVHLREIEGTPSPVKRSPEMTHEFGILSIDPSHALDIDDLEAGRARLHFLMPPDVVRQFEVPNDLHAAEICDYAVKAITDQGASPDSDWRSWWNEVIDKTAEHYRAGKHD